MPESEAGRPRFIDHKTKNMASDETAPVILTEDDIPGASLAGRNPPSLKNEELKFWLRCRGDSLKGLKRKAQLIKQRGLFPIREMISHAVWSLRKHAVEKYFLIILQSPRLY